MATNLEPLTELVVPALQQTFARMNSHNVAKLVRAQNKFFSKREHNDRELSLPIAASHLLASVNTAFPCAPS